MTKALLFVLFTSLLYAQEKAETNPSDEIKADSNITDQLLEELTDLKNFSNETTLNVVQSGGNSAIETYNAKSESTFQLGKNEMSLDGHYTLGFVELITEDGSRTKIETARNWHVGTQYARYLSKVFSNFGGIKIESDRFSGFYQRNNYDLGGKYLLVQTDKLKQHLEVGYRYSVEMTTAPNVDDETVFEDHKGRFYYEVSYNQNESLRYKFTGEYLPNFTRPIDYIISLNPSLSMVLSKTFSLSVSYQFIYDNDPAILGNRYVDYLYTTGITAKF